MKLVYHPLSCIISKDLIPSLIKKKKERKKNSAENSGGNSAGLYYSL